MNRKEPFIGIQIEGGRAHISGNVMKGGDQMLRARNDADVTMKDNVWEASAPKPRGFVKALGAIVVTVVGGIIVAALAYYLGWTH